MTRVKQHMVVYTSFVEVADYLTVPLSNKTGASLFLSLVVLNKRVVTSGPRANTFLLSMVCKQPCATTKARGPITADR